MSTLIIEEQSEWGSGPSRAAGKLPSVQTLLWSKALVEAGSRGRGEEDVRMCFFLRLFSQIYLFLQQFG